MRELARLAGQDLKNVLADIKALETLGLIESEGEQKERHRKALRTDWERLEVQVELSRRVRKRCVFSDRNSLRGLFASCLR